MSPRTALRGAITSPSAALRQREVGGLGRQLVLARRRIAQRQHRLLLGRLLRILLGRRGLRVLVRRDVGRLAPERRLLLLELGDLAFSPPTCSSSPRGRGLLPPFLGLLEVGVACPGLGVGLAVVLGQVLGVRRRLDLLVLVVQLDNLLVSLALRAGAAAAAAAWRRQRRHHHLSGFGGVSAGFSSSVRSAPAWARASSCARASASRDAPRPAAAARATVDPWGAPRPMTSSNATSRIPRPFAPLRGRHRPRPRCPAVPGDSRGSAARADAPRERNPRARVTDALPHERRSELAPTFSKLCREAR